MSNCIKCKNYTHLLNKCSEGNKISLTYPKVCLEKHPLEYKKPPTPNWTLEKAREDYIKNNKDCRRCKFGKRSIISLGYNMTKTINECLVKNTRVGNRQAEQCKYYTVESEDK